MAMSMPFSRVCSAPIVPNRMVSEKPSNMRVAVTGGNSTLDATYSRPRVG